MADVGYSQGVCPECGMTFDRSALTDCIIDSFGMSDGGVMVRGGMDDQPGMHIHGVTISPIGSLTVRAALRRYWHYKRLRLTWRVRRLATHSGCS